jgi:hypothetical protein
MVATGWPQVGQVSSLSWSRWRSVSAKAGGVSPATKRRTQLDCQPGAVLDVRFERSAIAVQTTSSGALVLIGEVGRVWVRALVAVRAADNLPSRSIVVDAVAAQHLAAAEALSWVACC